MADYTALDAPLYTVDECKSEIKRVDALIEEISSKPVGVGVPGVGNANYIGRLGDLRKEREVWSARRHEALKWERDQNNGTRVSKFQGPRQVIE
jgi:hypothetical protein